MTSYEGLEYHETSHYLNRERYTCKYKSYTQTFTFQILGEVVCQGLQNGIDTENPGNF